MIGRHMVATLALLGLSAMGWAAEGANSLGIKPGEIVYDREGGRVATVRRIDDDSAVLDTGAVKITLGFGSFRRREGRLVVPMNRDALEAAASKVQAAGDAEMLALLAPGAAFYDKAGVAVGTIVSVDAKQVVVEAGTLKAGLPLGAFFKGPEGARLSTSRAEFLAKLEAQRIASRPPAK